MMILQSLLLSLSLSFTTFFTADNSTSDTKNKINTAPMPDDIWKVLLKVKYSFSKNSYIPNFDENIKVLDGTTVTVKGFMYPIEEKTKHEFFYLSYYPVNVCFFCGGAGPESVIEVNAKEAMPLQSKAVTLRGKLKLNYRDRERLFFILLDAEML